MNVTICTTNPDLDLCGDAFISQPDKTFTQMLALILENITHLELDSPAAGADAPIDPIEYLLIYQPFFVS